MVTMQQVEAEEIAEQLGTVLASVEAGELQCSAAMRHRIEGAWLATAAIGSGPVNDRLSDTMRAIMSRPADQG
jgi:hypothetical protein